MELELHVVVSAAVILGTAFVALIVDYLKGSNEHLREHNIELRVRREEERRRSAMAAQPKVEAARTTPRVADSVAGTGVPVPATTATKTDHPEPVPIRPVEAPRAEGSVRDVLERAAMRAARAATAEESPDRPPAPVEVPIPPAPVSLREAPPRTVKPDAEGGEGEGLLDQIIASTAGPRIRVTRGEPTRVTPEQVSRPEPEPEVEKVYVTARPPEPLPPAAERVISVTPVKMEDEAGGWREPFVPEVFPSGLLSAEHEPALTSFGGHEEMSSVPPAPAESAPEPESAAPAVSQPPTEIPGEPVSREFPAIEPEVVAETPTIVEQAAESISSDLPTFEPVPAVEETLTEPLTEMPAEPAAVELPALEPQFIAEVPSVVELVAEPVSSDLPTFEPVPAVAETLTEPPTEMPAEPAAVELPALEPQFVAEVPTVVELVAEPVSADLPTFEPEPEMAETLAEELTEIAPTELPAREPQPVAEVPAVVEPAAEPISADLPTFELVPATVDALSAELPGVEPQPVAEVPAVVGPASDPVSADVPTLEAVPVVAETPTEPPTEVPTELAATELPALEPQPVAEVPAVVGTAAEPASADVPTLEPLPATVDALAAEPPSLAPAPAIAETLVVPLPEPEPAVAELPLPEPLPIGEELIPEVPTVAEAVEPEAYVPPVAGFQVEALRTQDAPINVVAGETVPVELSAFAHGLLLQRSSGLGITGDLTDLACGVEAEPVPPARIDLPAGYHSRQEPHQSLSSADLFTGFAACISINDFERIRKSASSGAFAELMASIEKLVRGLLREGDFACRIADDEFVLAYPALTGAAAQRRASHISERLWDFQLRSLGSFSVLFSWGGVEVQDEPFAESVASAIERMNETRISRRAGRATPATYAKRLAS